MTSVNQITLIGNLGKDIKSAGNADNPIVNFSVATEHSYKAKSGERVSETDWHRVVAFGQIAKYIAQYAATGRQVYIQGRLRTRSYDKDGSTRYVTEIVAETFNFLGSKPDADRAPREAQAPAQHAAPAPAATPAAQHSAPAGQDDDIPF